ncbi:hypothetical protein ACFLT1_05140 [Bacteroidota bacterium]
MSYTKISSILLYVVATISLVVMLFFYASPKTLNINELEDRVLALTTDDIMPAADEQVASDSTATDSLAMEGETDMTADLEADSSKVDSLAMAAANNEITTAEETQEVVDLRDHLTGWELMVYKRTDYALGWAYILLIIAAIAALVFPILNIATDLKSIIRLVSLLGAAAILILLSYFVLASDATINILGYTGTENSNPVVLKWVGTGLFSTYFLFGLAVLSILYSEVVKIFK